MIPGSHVLPLTRVSHKERTARGLCASAGQGPPLPDPSVCRSGAGKATLQASGSGQGPSWGDLHLLRGVRGRVQPRATADCRRGVRGTDPSPGAGLFPPTPCAGKRERGPRRCVRAWWPPSPQPHPWSIRVVDRFPGGAFAHLDLVSVLYVVLFKQKKEEGRQSSCK